MGRVILLVDDDTGFRDSVRETLELHDFEVVEVVDGTEALAFLEKEDVSLVVTDILMPNMEGNELAMSIKEMRPDMKIIARASEEEATSKLLLAEQTLGATEIRQQTGALILALKRADGSISFNPHSDTTIQSGDYLIAVGSVQHLRALASFAQS